MPITIIALGVVLLLVLMIVFKANGFIALVFVSAVVGIAEGMTPLAVVASIQKGIGGTLGSLAMILGFGAMLGKLVSDTGAAQRVATTLINAFGKQRVQWALMVTGLIVGLAMFYEIGFVLLLPLVFTVVAAAGMPLLYVGVPMVAALSVTHCFLPPHPGPTAIATIFGANLGTTLLYGIVITIPTVIIAGPLFSRCLKNFEKEPPEGLYNPKIFAEDEMPGFGISIFAAIIPVILMAVAAVFELTLPKENAVRQFFEFIGNPAVALFISVVIAVFTLGLRNGRKAEDVMEMCGSSIASIAMIVFIIAGGGAFKQVLVDSGVGEYIAGMMEGSSLSPLLMCWTVAAMLRIALGSATVAAITTAGIVTPIIAVTHADPALMVLAVGSGSVIASHVNDPGFWLFKGYFNLSVTETLRTWTVMETLISVLGLAGVLILDTIVH
ncbi:MULTISPECIES: gluconate:H+ symporter [Tatumella]|uniref:L-idonate, D-gluconate, 5-keto-D-gluconate transporter n=2 Tax=Tatumella ptyseos TaxID=82987 RepID=A0A085JQK1_9GAMM|nr:MULTISPECIES: gluconate:H+ symporter [Tatumella]KFD22747.1 L-idonate, D-gluconate, 5-keto-D-gluconate transporter [Tatumella ptyseos ATCC 33301]SQK72309.1 5-keto-D-gluconate transporter [Tatumella ptyseos]